MNIQEAGICYRVSHQGESRLVHFLGSFEHPDKGYDDVPYALDGVESVNGVLVAIEPHRATSVLQVVDPQVKFEDGAMGGSGWFLGINPEGKIVCLAVNAKVNKKRVIYGAGWTFCWVAGPQGLVVMDTTEPPYRPEMEVEIVRGSPNDNLSAQFWQKLDALKY